MVCHETYKDAAGNWLLPEEVELDGDKPALRDGGGPVTVGRSEKMSKSQKNVVDPESIIDAYGADTARLFMLSDSPPERDLDWTDSGIEGAWRYANRLWRLINQPEKEFSKINAEKPEAISGAALATEKAIHITIASVSSDLDKFHFNKAVARIRELTNTLDALEPQQDGAAWVRRHGLEVAICLIGPMMPHLAEDLWHSLGHETLLADTAWPVADPNLLVENSVTIAVQVNGKLRGTLELAKDSNQKSTEEAALSLHNVASAIGDKPIRKVIIVPNRIVNVVI
jgi:leucyl-tRNA synthetase